MGEAINLVENFKVEKVIFNCGEFNELEQELIEVLDKKKMPYYSCIKELNIDDNKLYFLNNAIYGNENDNSSVIYTKLNNHKFLFMGDVGVEVEEDLIEKYNLKNIDVLKVGHHGSKTSFSEEFIDSINPKYSIISVGKNNRYKLPNNSVLDNLEDSKMYRIDQDGSIMFKIKNNKLEIETCSPKNLLFFDIIKYNDNGGNNMNDRIIKNALSYALGSDLHEAWRAPRKRTDGTFEPRIKKSKDEAWNANHGTDEVDIANCSFEQLPSNWQYENLEAARVAIELVYDKTVSGEQFMSDEIEQMASIIHDEWLKRNDWVFNPEYGDPKLAVPYAQLSKEEQDKDKAQLRPAQAKVQAYISGLINIEEICAQYNLPTSSKSL